MQSKYYEQWNKLSDFDATVAVIKVTTEEPEFEQSSRTRAQISWSFLTKSLG